MQWLNMGKIIGQEHVDKTKFGKNCFPNNKLFSFFHRLIRCITWEMIWVQYEDESPKKAVAHSV